MKSYLKRLSAVQELLLHEEAKRTFQYLKWACGNCGGLDTEGLWAVAHNAALTAFSLHQRGKRVFSSSEEVLRWYSLEEIAGFAMEYQKKFEGEENE